MTNNPAEVLLDRWTNDPSFAQQLKTNTEAALKSCGIEPEEEIINALKDLDPGESVEELQKRVSKWWLLWGGGW